MPNKIAWLALTMCGFLTGCTTVTSTMLNRTDNDVFVGNSNGEPNANCGATPFKGIPITVKVPTHLDVTISETYYLTVGKVKRADGTFVDELMEIPVKHRNLDVDADLVETDKLFTVDFPRPGSGTLDYKLDFGQDGDSYPQYFKQIKNKIVDDTIKDVSMAVESVIPKLASLTGAGSFDASDELKKQMVVGNRVVAWRRFDISAPDFEWQVKCFVQKHVNNCNECELNKTPPNYSDSTAPNSPVVANEQVPFDFASNSDNVSGIANSETSTLMSPIATVPPPLDGPTASPFLHLTQQ